MRALAIIVFSVCFGCTERRTSANKDFIELKDKLLQIETPVSFNSKNNISLKEADLVNNQILERLKGKNQFRVFGKVFENENYITIIGFVPDDLGSPILITIDQKGNEVDSFLLYQSAVSDIGYYRSNFITINQDKTFVIIDSLLMRKLNKDETVELPGTDSLIVSKSSFGLSDRGKIEKID